MAVGVGQFHPVLATWFSNKFGEATDVQRQAWPLIANGKHTLISAPTGSGKTLAAIMPLLNQLVQCKLGDSSNAIVRAAATEATVLEHAKCRPEQGQHDSKRSERGERDSELTERDERDVHENERSERGVRILYVTPLKALNNDIRRHLFDFADEWRQTAAEISADWPDITVGVRTGDTTQSTRASMLRKPPDILVTTPESLFILLTSRKARNILRTVQHVVVDEIHDLAASERGTHFSISLERLTWLCGVPPQRIGVSATQNPVERMARFLGGWNINGTDPDVPRPVSIVESRMDRKLEVRVTMPPYGILLKNKREDIWTPLVEEILRHIGEGTTLIFVGNRRLCERLSARLNQACGEGFCASHHGSVSREQRLETEQLLREGKLRCLVATSSLELGIDVGDIDHVLQIDSPFTAASGIQRFGRSGHAVGGTSRGTIIVRTRGLLPEIAVLAERIGRKWTEPITVPQHSVAVLTQQIAAIVAGDDWEPDALYRMICASDAYHAFPQDRFEEILHMLAGRYPVVRPLIDWVQDQKRGILKSRPNSAMAAITGAGTIPQSTAFPVYHAESRVHLGELDEEYVFESRVGDVFQLGASNWRIRSIRSDRVEVVESNAAFGEIPFWRAEGVGRSFELGVEIGKLIEQLDRMLQAEAATADLTKSEGLIRYEAEQLLTERYLFTAEAANSLLELIKSQRAVSAWPTHQQIVTEWYTDEAGLTHVVIHSLFGRRFNRTWLLAILHYLEQSYEHDIQSTAKDNGIELIFRVWDPELLHRIRGVHAGNIEQLLLEAVPLSPMFAARFRQLAETSLFMTRGFRRIPAWLKRLRGEELLRDALKMGETFPLIKETLRECMEQLLDLPRLRQVLEQLESGTFTFRTVKCSHPSPLAAQFFFDFLNVAIYESDALTRDLQQRMKSISRELAADIFGADAVSEANGEQLKATSFQVGHMEARQYVRYLQIGHHLDPTSKLQGAEGVLQALTPLQGLYLPLSWWESFVLPSRVSGYRSEDLDLLCASGELFWLGRKEDGVKEGKIAFFRADTPELVSPFMPNDEVVPQHPELYELLRARGASFLTALANDTGEKPSAILDQLLDLVWQGLVTNDQFAPVRLHGQKGASTNRGKFRSGFGRWYAVTELQAIESDGSATERAVLGWTRHLLRFGGVLTKALVQSFSPFGWETHLAALSRMEELGVVTRGLLVRDIHALQFAERQVAELLRNPIYTSDSADDDPNQAQSDIVLVNSADPANPYGLTVDWPTIEGRQREKFVRKPGNFLLMKDGRFLIWAGNNGRKITTVESDQPDDLPRQAEYIRYTAYCLLKEQGKRKVVIESWNGQPIARTELGEHLIKLGAERDGDACVLWPSSL